MGACLYINYIYGGKGAMVAKAIATVLLLFACFRIVVTASTTSWRTSTSITSIQYLSKLEKVSGQCGFFKKIKILDYLATGIIYKL